MLLDQFNDLTVGPLPPDAEATWDGRPWVDFAASPDLEFDCDYPTWVATFSRAMPKNPFEVQENGTDSGAALPQGFRVEQSGDGWVVRDDQGACWCGLEENG